MSRRSSFTLVILSILMLGMGLLGLSCWPPHEIPTPTIQPTPFPSSSPFSGVKTPRPLATPSPSPARDATATLPKATTEPLEPTVSATEMAGFEIRIPSILFGEDVEIESTSPPVTPTPAWPEPLRAPGPSKLGLHVVRNDAPEIMEFVRRVRPAVVKAVDDVGWLTEVKRVSPETVTIGRLAATHQDMNGDPALAAQAFVAEQLTRYQLNPGADYWEGWNEPDPGEQMGWYAAFEAERVRLMAEHGLRAAVGGFASGVPEWSEFLAFLPAIEAARQHDGILSLHEYGAPTLDYLVGTPLPGWPGDARRGVLALRYRWWYEEILIPRGMVIPLVISETGIDGILMSGERPGPEGLGWRDFSDYWDAIGIGGGVEGYIRQLGWYDSELRQDDYVIGFTVFTAGGGEGWSSYDVNSILPQMAFYVAEAH